MIHGGETITEAKILTPEVISLIHQHDDLAPLHNPPTIMGVEAAKSFFPEIPHVGVFDTAFHSTLPEEAFVYGLNYSLYENHGIRRYGYHGPSHQYVAMEAAKILNIPVEECNCVSCHLGNGVSLTAVRNGKSVDTSLGFGTMCGVPMGTRAGDFDPDIVLYMMDSLGMTGAEVKDLIYKESGLKGLSGISNDVRDIDEAAARGNKRAQLALKVFAHAARKFIAAMATNLEGRMDALVFTAGIGENEYAMRSRICRGLEIMGIELDEDKNARNEECISTSASKVSVLVIPTDEERMIALETKRVVESPGESS
jgi:acetate kinase